MKPIYVIFSLLILAPLSACASEPLDAPITVRTVDDLFAAGLRLKDQLKGSDPDNFDHAITHITAYGNVSFDRHSSASEKDALIVALTNGQTPRQIIILGHVLWLESNRRELSEDKTGSTNSQIPPAELRMEQVKRQLGEANIKAAMEVIRLYLKPVQAPPPKTRS